MGINIFLSIKKFADMALNRRWVRKEDVSHHLTKGPLSSTDLTSASYIPNLTSNPALSSVTDTAGRLRPEQAAFMAELEQISLERPFNHLKALERKAEIEARYVFLQRVHEEPARLEILLNIYAEWVSRTSTPSGLADFVLAGHYDETVGNGEALVEGVKDVEML